MPSVIIQKVKHERAAEVARARAANALASQSVKAKNVRAQALRQGGAPNDANEDARDADCCVVCHGPVGGAGAKGDGLRLRCKIGHEMLAHVKCWERKKAQFKRALAGSRRVVDTPCPFGACANMVLAEEPLAAAGAGAAGAAAGAGAGAGEAAACLLCEQGSSRCSR